jgi:hypothetical protein
MSNDEFRTPNGILLKSPLDILNSTFGVRHFSQKREIDNTPDMNVERRMGMQNAMSHLKNLGIGYSVLDIRHSFQDLGRVVRHGLSDPFPLKI